MAYPVNFLNSILRQLLWQVTGWRVEFSLSIYIKKIKQILTMYDKENIIKDIYNALEKLKYPEVAQINYKEFETTILIGNERLKFLYWLLQENPNFNCSLLNKLKESSLEGKLFKCYSQMGFCNNEDILLGKCKVDEQLEFLLLLSLFIKRIHLAKNESPKYDEKPTKNLIKADIISPSKNCSSGEKELSDSAIAKRNNDLENMCCNIKSILEESKENENNNNHELKLQKFHTSFKNVTNIPLTKCHSNKSSNDFNVHIEQIHTKFSTVNKVLFNEVEFKNRPTEAETNEMMAEPLSLVTNKNVVLLEQACNMLKEDQM